MVTSLFAHERIRTTKAKAKAVRRTAEKMITRAKEDSVHNRRIVFKDMKDQAVLAKLFTDIGPRFKNRAGGYTRILKLGQRRGDASEMVLLELVERNEPEQKKPRRRQRSQEQPAEQDANASEETAAE
jgi:large subunit ribosomal protein L17